MKLNELIQEHSYSEQDFLDIFGLDCCVKQGSKFYTDFDIQFNCTPHKDFDQLPIAFSKTKNFCIYDSRKLNTLKGFPEECHTLQIFECPKVTSLEHCTPLINGNFDIRGCGITSFVGISNIITRINGEFYFDCDKIKEGGIGLIFIEDLIDLQPGGEDGYVAGQWSIIRKYLRQPNKLYDCQAELIEAGYEEFAKL